MAKKKIETIVKEKIYPHTLNQKGTSTIAKLCDEYSYELLCECINIAASQYFRYDEDGQLTKESAEVFINKIGGIAHNKSLSPINQQIMYLLNLGKLKFTYWNRPKAESILKEYVNQLSLYGWNESMITNDLKTETLSLINGARNWSDFVSKLEHWTSDVKQWIIDKNSTAVTQLGTILPDAIIEDLPSNIINICQQINASYENNLFDCTAVLMRRLLESLLVITFQNANLEDEITDKSGKYHLNLDGIIKKAQQNQTLGLSSNTKNDMMLFKDLGNYSAHKIWYNCTQGDIKPNALKYRAIIEELLYKSGIKE